MHRHADELRREGSRVVGLSAGNSIDWVLADLAALAGGMTLVPIPPWFTAAQRRHLIVTSKMDTLLIEDRSVTAGEHHGFERCPVRIGRLAVLRRQSIPDMQSADPPATAKMTFTSGSTGQPKGVRLARGTIDLVACRLHQVLADLAIDRHLCVMPLATLLENIAGVYVPLMLGTHVHVPDVTTLGLFGSSRFDVRCFRDTLASSKAQSLILTPQLLRALTASCRGGSIRDGQLKFVAVGGARVSDSDLDAAANCGVPAYQGYGLSECASVVALNRPGDQRAGSVGRPLPGLDIDFGDDGEILVSGQCMLGYLGDGDEQLSVVATGDTGYLDEDGFLYVTGRKKNMFITSYGRNVTPEWPEAELLAQPEIAQACVFGEGRPANTAVIVPAEHGVADAIIERAVRRANGTLPDYARIADWIIAHEPFSAANGLMTVTGKTRRQAVELRHLGASPPARSGEAADSPPL
jgi:long-subunit acyl-CoA synthetase (AMP-forming)